jgi:hypothetical protein
VLTSANLPSEAKISLRSIQPDSPRKFDEYGALSSREEKKRLDNFASELKRWADVQGRIFVFAGAKTKLSKTQAIARRTISYLVNKRGIDPNQVLAIVIAKDKEHSEFSIELWMGYPLSINFLTSLFSGESTVVIGNEVKK